MAIFNLYKGGHVENIQKGDVLTELSNPRVISMRKKIKDQKVENGSVAIASGYTTNTRPGPGMEIIQI